MNTTNFGGDVSDAWACAGDAPAASKANDKANSPKRQFIGSRTSGLWLLTLRRRAGRKTECRGHRDPPAIGRLHENPLGHPTGCSVFLGDRIAVRSINHAGHERQHPQVLRYECVWPRRIPPRAPGFVTPDPILRGRCAPGSCCEGTSPDNERGHVCGSRRCSLRKLDALRRYRMRVKASSTVPSWTTPVENVIHHRTGLPLERAA